MVDLPSHLDAFKLLATLSALSVAHFAVKVIKRSRRLKELSGPPPESFFAGNIPDIKSAQVGTRYNVWQKQYGGAYKIHGALSVRLCSLKWSGVDIIRTYMFAMSKPRK